MKMKSSVIISFMLSGCGYGTSQLDTLRENRAGIQSLKAGDAAMAGEHFAQALATEPFQSALHLNFALALDAQKRPDEALQSLKTAESMAASADAVFYSRFNRAEIQGRAKKVDEALVDYQGALELRPNSLEVKTNIELLIAQQQQQQQNQNKDGEGQPSKDNKDGKGEQNKDQKASKDSQKDPKDDQKDPKDPKDGKDQQKKMNPQGDAKYKPRPFQGELSEGDVKKILGEIKQQEQKIRAEYNRKDVKERPRDKDW